MTGIFGCSLPEWADNGLKLGPNYQAPAAGIAENWIDSDDPQVLECPPSYVNWWAVYQDPVLEHLIETAYQQNLSVREAGWRIVQARAQRAIVVGDLFPQDQFLNGGYTRRQISDLAQPLLVPEPEFRRSFDNWLYGGKLSWELDVWGRFRRSVESADAGLDASVAEYDAILISLIAEVATTYIEIRTLEQRLEYAQKNVRTQEESLRLTKTRAEEGKTADVSVHLAKSNLASTKATIPSLEIGLRQANNRLCTLLGFPTSDLHYMLGDGTIPPPPAQVAVGIPADLLRRRPDVRAAERRVAAQSAQIGVALANLYPSISITGEIVVTAENFSDLSNSLSWGGSIGPSFRWNFLNYGRLISNVHLQNARLQELITTYQNTVLVANEEVESALVSYLRTQRQVVSLSESAQETKRALELELLRFQEGETDFSGVFVLQGDLALKQDQLATAQGRVASSLAEVYKALGGGWEISCREVYEHPGEYSEEFVLSPIEETGEIVPPQPTPRLDAETSMSDLPEN
ncbi:efflux transporter outer membrane subunit [Thalassoglobus sp. JC818]|uniref:efflux transporter outer membrane subunit n=1 Tax=Thalassoglobus sp. JC818 TaxID=3232136 RepID=UPI0034590BD4